MPTAGFTPVGEKIKNFLQTKAPILLNKVGEFLPDKGALGIVKNIISIATPEEIKPEDKEAALKILEEEFQLAELNFKDTDSARNLQVAALNQQDKFSKRYIYYLSTFIILSATGFGISLIFFDIPEKNKRLIEMFADIYLFAGAMTVLNFFFGNIHSQQKQSTETTSTIEDNNNSNVQKQ